MASVSPEEPHLHKLSSWVPRPAQALLVMEAIRAGGSQGHCCAVRSGFQGVGSAEGAGELCPVAVRVSFPSSAGAWMGPGLHSHLLNYMSRDNPLASQAFGLGTVPGTPEGRCPNTT